MRRLFPVLAPAIVIACFLAIILLDRRPTLPTDSAFTDRGDRDPEAEIVELPHGRVLYIVVEPDGVYVGQERVPPDQFAEYLRLRTRLFSPDYFIIAGTDAAQFGDVVRAFDAARRAFHIGYLMDTRPLPTGTRRPRIRVAQNFWDY